MKIDPKWYRDFSVTLARRSIRLARLFRQHGRPDLAADELRVAAYWRMDAAFMTSWSKQGPRYW